MCALCALLFSSMGCDSWLPWYLCRGQRICLQVQRPNMEDALPWAKEVFPHLGSYTLRSGLWRAFDMGSNICCLCLPCTPKLHFGRHGCCAHYCSFPHRRRCRGYGIGGDSCGTSYVTRGTVSNPSAQNRASRPSHDQWGDIPSS